MNRINRAKALSVFSFFVMGLTGLAFQNCSQFAAVSKIEKQNFLNQNRIFSASSTVKIDPAQPVEAVETIKLPEAVSAPVPQATPPATSAPPDGIVEPGSVVSPVGVVVGRNDLPVEFLCSTAFFNANSGMTLSSVQGDLKAVFYRASNPDQSLCEFTDPAIKEVLRANKTVMLGDVKARCPSLEPGEYQIAVVPASQTSGFRHNLLYRSELGNGGQFGIENQLAPYLDQFQLDVVVEASQGTLLVKYANKPKASKDGIHFIETHPVAVYAENRFGAGDPNCVYNVSPLIVQLRRPDGLARRLELTAQFAGVMFDILGLRSIPTAHTKHKISWLTKGSAQDHYYIVLPDRNGRVEGIEQMFGDNTSGPDGKFAGNGYEALAKFDGRTASGKIDREARDGFIDADDEVFTRLRFWRDENTNGVAEASELHTLMELGVDTIDLNYDDRHKEMDRFGNKILMKSVVRTTDGRLHAMYDLWFRLVQ